MTHLDLIATATAGLEAVVAREVKALGYEPGRIDTGRVPFTADEAGICRSNLWLRCADRVLLRVGEFDAPDFDALFEQTMALPWERWLPADAAFPVQGRSVKSQLSSVPACQRTVKKAIVERLADIYGLKWFEETGPKCVIEVSLLKDRATLTIDTSGAGLHKRGYRRLVGPAPLKETLAAGMVLLSFWRPDRPLIDPFCGSGTIPIEAALIGRNIAPGLERTFAAQGWPWLAGQLWDDARTEARDLIKPDLPERIIGTDIDEEVLSLARHHARLASVAEDVHFQQQAFADLASSRQFGCVICNPPYGQRLSQAKDIGQLYESIPLVLRGLPTWSHFILTAWPGFEKLLGRKADRRRKLYNGPIECTYYQFHGPRKGDRPVSGQAPSQDKSPESGAPLASGPPVAEEGKASVPVFGGLTDKARRQAEVFANRLGKMARHRRRWPKRRGITCYRLYNRDIPEVPLAVDLYEHALHIAEYDRPHDRDAAQHADWLDLMVRTAAKTLSIPVADVHLKRRQRQRGISQYGRVGEKGKVIEVGEGGLRFEVNLTDYLDTGLFLDHRLTRAMVRDEAAGKRFLNLFGYTGAFTVYAAAGGAASTVTVDRSEPYLAWARRNMALNGFAGDRHRYVRAETMRFLADHPAGAHYDLAVVDPPTFSNRKGEEDYWDVQRDHADLLQRLARLMPPTAVIYFATNFRRFKLADDKLAWAEIREITGKTVPEDFARKRPHRCWRLVVKP